MNRRKFIKVTRAGALALVAKPALAGLVQPAGMGTRSLPLTCPPDPLATRTVYTAHGHRLIIAGVLVGYCFRIAIETAIEREDQGQGGLAVPV